MKLFELFLGVLDGCLLWIPDMYPKHMVEIKRISRFGSLKNAQYMGEDLWPEVVWSNFCHSPIEKSKRQIPA